MLLDTMAFLTIGCTVRCIIPSLIVVLIYIRDGKRWFPDIISEAGFGDACIYNR